MPNPITNCNIRPKIKWNLKKGNLGRLGVKTNPRATKKALRKVGAIPKHPIVIMFFLRKQAKWEDE